MVMKRSLPLTVVLFAAVTLFTLVSGQDISCKQEFFQNCGDLNSTAGITTCCTWIGQEFSTDRSCLCDIFEAINFNNIQALQLLKGCKIDTTGVGTVCPGTPPPSSTPISAPSPTTTSSYPPPFSTPTSAPPPTTSLTSPPRYSTPPPTKPPTTTSTPPPPPETFDTPPPPYDDSPPAPPDYTPISPTSLGSENDGPAPAPPKIPPKKPPLLSTAAIAGIAGGGAFLLIVAGILLLFILLRRRRRPGPAPQPPVVDRYPNVPQLPQQVPSYGRQHENVKPPQPPAREIVSHPQFEPVLPPRQYNDSPWNSNRNPNVNRQPPPVFQVAKADSSKSTITYEELSVATNGFSADNLLGESRLGLVYRGKLDDARDVAVKKLNKDTWKRIGDKQLQKEIEKISSINHINLVALVGYCITSDEKLLVYEYVPNNTLEFHLHGSDEGQQTLHWPTRMSIVLGSAKGLAYLHEQCRQTIIHGDIKASNILLDDKFEPQIADFGLDKLFFANKNRAVIGTFGYIAPEYAATGKLTAKSDVFSFGVVILELITGLKPTSESGPFADRSMVDWAIPLMTYALQIDDFIQLVDQELENKYDQQQMRWMVACALSCLRSKADLRPKMSEILRTLEGEMSMDKLNHGVEPGKSMIFRPVDVSEIEAMRKKASGRKSQASNATAGEQFPSSTEFS